MDKQTIEEYGKEARRMLTQEQEDERISVDPKAVALIVAGRMVADAIDRHTEMVNNHNMRQASLMNQLNPLLGIQGDFMGKLMQEMDEQSDGDKWKRGRDKDKEDGDGESTF